MAAALGWPGRRPPASASCAPGRRSRRRSPSRTGRRSAGVAGPAGCAAGSSRRWSGSTVIASRSSRAGTPGTGSLRWSRSTGRSWSASTLASPAACAVISVPKRERPVRDLARRSASLAGDLQEHALRRSALVVLTGRVQEPRAPAEAGRPLGALATAPAGRRAGRRRARGRRRPSPRGSRRRQAATAAHRPRRRAMSTPSSRPAVPRTSMPPTEIAAGSGSGRVVEQAAGGRLGALDVRLVERVDPEHAARDRGRDLPRQHLRAERARDRDPGLAERAGRHRRLAGRRPARRRRRRTPGA